MPFNYEDNGGDSEIQDMGSRQKVNTLTVGGLGLLSRPKKRKPKRDPTSINALAEKANMRGNLGRSQFPNGPVSREPGRNNNASTTY